MNCADNRTRRRDILANPWLALAFFGLPVIAIVLAGRAAVGDGWRTVVWTAALGTMGAACVANALRCGRAHCYMTGPFFLAMAVFTLLFGLGVVPLGRNGWNLIGLTIFGGTIVLCCVPELLFGRYRSSDGTIERSSAERRAKAQDRRHHPE